MSFESIHWLNAIPLGLVVSWSDNKKSTIDWISFPGQDAGYVEGVDTLGVSNPITIRGRLVGTFNDINSYIVAIKGILDGNQSGYSTLRSPLIGTTKYVSGTGNPYLVGRMGINSSVSSGKLVDSSALFITTNGVQYGDIVRNEITGEIASVTNVSETQLTLSEDIFTSSDTPYALAVTMRVKLSSFNPEWSLPGMTWCDYVLEVVQVKS